MLERLQKILSARGVASRRKAEEYIERGLVKVNGVIAKLGDKADPAVDTIEVDGEVLQERQEMLYYVLNKPAGVETSNVDREGQKSEARTQGERGNQKPETNNQKLPAETAQQSPTVRNLLPPALRGKIYPVGRLDKDSEGLLLFTNDGVLAYRLTHPSFEHQKEYEVSLDRPIDPIAVKKLEEGFLLDGSMTKPLQIRKVAPNVIRITLTEGRNRQIRRMCQHVGYTVKKLRRVRIMTLEDSRLKMGGLRELTDQERTALLASVGL